MDFKAQQKIFDDIKWFESIRAEKDLCGTYGFCPDCRKSDEYPCARAAHRKENGYIRIAVLRLRRKIILSEAVL